MFAIFTGTNGKSVRIDPDAVLAIEELDKGCRIHIGSGPIDVRESAEAVAAELVGDEDEEDDD